MESPDKPFLARTGGALGPASFLMKRLSEKNAALMRELTVGEQREARERLADVRIIMPGIAVEDAVCAGVPCQWIGLKEGLRQDKVILYLHGGSWAFGSLRTAKAFGVLLAEATACKVLVADYRLAPEFPFPAGLDDCFAVYQWLLACGYGEENIALFGDSAGGNLSLCLLNRLKKGRFRQPSCAATASPVTDLRESAAIVSSGVDLIYTRHEGAAIDIFTMYADGADRNEPDISPIMGDLAGLPPILIHAGGDEPLAADNIAYAEKAYSRGVDVGIKIWDGMFHDFTIVGRTLRESRQSVAETAVFYRKHLIRDASGYTAPLASGAF